MHILGTTILQNNKQLYFLLHKGVDSISCIHINKSNTFVVSMDPIQGEFKYLQHLFYLTILLSNHKLLSTNIMGMQYASDFCVSSFLYKFQLPTSNGGGRGTNLDFPFLLCIHLPVLCDCAESSTTVFCCWKKI